MLFESLQNKVNDALDLIEINATALVEGRDRSAKFLVFQALLANHLKDLQDARTKMSTIVDASYAQVMATSSGKNVTENKIMAEADPAYSTNRENLELIDSEINWVKTHMDIFNNAHLMFRQYSRE